MPPLTRGPHLRLLALPPGLLGQCLLPVCPLLLPLAAFPGGFVGNSHSLWQGVHCSPPPPPSEALSTGRGASRRRLTSVSASGSSLPAALTRRAPMAGVRLGRAMTAHPTRSVESGPRGRPRREMLCIEVMTGSFDSSLRFIDIITLCLEKPSAL